MMAITTSNSTNVNPRRRNMARPSKNGEKSSSKEVEAGRSAGITLAEVLAGRRRAGWQE
jgi:hypothetical protein